MDQIILMLASSTCELQSEVNGNQAAARSEGVYV